MEEWTRQKARIEQRIHDIELRAAQQAVADADAARADALEVRWPSLDVEERRAVIRSVLVHVNVKPASRVGPFRFDPARLTYRLRADGLADVEQRGPDAPDLSVVA